MTTYSVSDLLIRIKNGYLANRETINVSYSRFGEELLTKLKKLKYIKAFKKSEDKRDFVVGLLYTEGSAAITDVKIFSTPGRRWYIKTKKIKPVLSGMGFAILSTPKGILTNIEARKENVGGELLFHVW